MKYTCDVCGRQFTTKSGCSRHEKACAINAIKPALYNLTYDIVNDKVIVEELSGEWTGYELDKPFNYGETWCTISKSNTLSEESKLKILKVMASFYNRHLEWVYDQLGEYNDKLTHYTRQLELVNKRLKALKDKEAGDGTSV